LSRNISRFTEMTREILSSSINSITQDLNSEILFVITVFTISKRSIFLLLLKRQLLRSMLLLAQ